MKQTADRRGVRTMPERRSIDGAIAVVLLLLVIAACFAAIHGRGLYQDGAYYLYRLAEREWFYLYDPARVTTQALRQAPVVAAIKFGDFSLFQLGGIFSASLLIWPVVLAGSCWFIAPADARVWALFPLLGLLMGFCTTSFEAIGEASIAVGYFWALLFLLLFRARTDLSRALSLLLFIPAFGLHEAVCLLMPALLWVCWMRWRKAVDWTERLFLGCVAVLVVMIIAYQLRWMIHPRIPGEREAAVSNIVMLRFLYADGALNLPVVTAAAGAASLIAIEVLRLHHRKGGSDLIRFVALAFVAFAAAMSLVAWTVDATFSPRSQDFSRYNPVFVSVLLAAALIASVELGRIPWGGIGVPVVAVVLALAVAQTVTDVAATVRWKGYIADFRQRLDAAAGLAAWDYGGPPQTRRASEWKLMTMGWVHPIMSIVLAKDGNVGSILDYPPGTPFKPIDPRAPEQLARLRGVSFERYTIALRAMALPLPAP